MFSGSTTIDRRSSPRARIAADSPPESHGFQIKDKKTTISTTTAAAAIVLIAGIVATILNDGSPAPGRLEAASLIPTGIWESNNIEADDENLAALAAEIEQIENEVMTLESGDDTSDSDRTVEELEIELIVVSSDFWKE